MKKAIIWILLCMVTVLPLQVAAAAEVAVHASVSAVKPDVEVTFMVSVNGAADVRSMAVMPLYDKECFTLVEGRWLISGTLSNFDTQKDVGAIAFASMTQVDTQVLSFTLRAKKAAEAGEQQIGSTVVLSDGAGNRTELTAAAATVTVEGAKDPLPETTTDTKPTETQPVEIKPTATESTETQPTSAEPDTQPTEPEPSATEQTEAGQQLPVEHRQEQTQSNTEDAPQVTAKTDGENLALLWIWCGVIAAVGLCAAAAVLYKKKRSQ